MQFDESIIDDRFYNSESNAPFETCMVCSKQVITDGNDYFVERIFRKLPGEGQQHEVLFEYAMCHQCADDMRKELSKESLQRIEQLFLKRVEELQEDGIKPTMDECFLTGKAIDDAQEFSYHAHCRGHRLIHSLFPYAISDEGMDIISEQLSDETTDQLGDFKGRYFTGPPEFSDLLNPKRLMPL